MSDFDKKKSSVNNNENYNKKVDHTDDDIYEIPDIVSNGKKSSKMEDRKDKKKKTDHTQKHMFEKRKGKIGHSGGTGIYFGRECKGQVPDG